jgi:hypothetical protein
MVGSRFRKIAIVAAGLALAAAAEAADTVKIKKPPAAPRGFYEKFLAPRMTSGLNQEVSAAAYFANPTASPWTRDNETVSRIEKGAIRATKSALKRYAIESMGIDAWSLPLVGGGGRGLDALKTESGGARLRFGISHLAPRAEVLIPATHGRVAFSADARGRLATSFESTAANFRLGVSYDVPGHAGTFLLIRRF